MAKFLEYQGKNWLRKAGLPIPDGQVAYTAEQARDIARHGKPVAVKGQVKLVGEKGRHRQVG